MSRWLADGELAETALRQDIPGASVTPVVHTPDYEVVFSETQARRVERLLERFAANPAAPPTVKDVVAEIGDELFSALIDGGDLIPLNAEVVFRRPEYEHWVSQIRGMLQSQGTITVAQVRDRFQTSRRYVLALLEHLDAIGVTARDGDVRKLK
jgi:selenocysteine-specific elongation factor